MMWRVLFILMICFWVCPSQVIGGALVVKYGQQGFRYKYQIELLELGLRKTESSDGNFMLVPVMVEASKKRMIMMFKSREWDIMWMAATKERCQAFLHIPVPLLRGLLGYRVFLIHRDNVGDFKKIETFNALRSEFEAGFGSQWADLTILQQNGIKVQKTPQYENLFGMLVAKRFDYFPRGIDEAWLEVEKKRALYPQIVVEENLCLYYPYPHYFFVHKDNSGLADRVYRGLQSAIMDGSFQKLFLKYYGGYVIRAKLKNRRIFQLKNHNLPEGMAEPDTSWWMTDPMK